MDRQAAQNLEVSPSKIGIATNIAEDQLKGLKSRVFAGAQTVELGFAGQGKGFLKQGATTPGMYGKEEREAMKQLAKTNKVNLQTHASVNVMGFSGLGQKGFDEEARQQSINEVKRAVDFAGDVAEGGSVTVHTAEFPRPLAGTYKEFETHPDEDKIATLYLVDRHTGEIINVIKKDQKIHAPEWQEDENGNYILDEYGRKKPIWDEKGKEFKLIEKSYDTYVEEADKWNKQNKDKIERGEEKIKTAEYAMYEDVMGMRAGYNRAFGAHHEHNVEQTKEKREKIEKALKIYEKIEAGVPEEEKWQLMRQFREDTAGIIPPETKLPSEYLKEQLYHYDKQIEHDTEMAIHLREQAKEAYQKIDDAQPMGDYAIKKTKDSLSRLGIYAMDKTKAQNLPKPLFISPENLDLRGPGYGGYGSHPEELKRIILESREEMANKLIKDRGMSEAQAKGAADEHIKATFDIGHAYTWKKFFKGDKKDFDKWLFKQVDELNKAGVIGKVHLSDNFGYYDEHTTPGEADVPLKEFVQKMRKAGFKDQMIVEPAHQEQQVMLDAWKTLQSPIYKIDHTSKTWTDIQGSYFGKTHSPSYMVGEGVVPDVKEWTLWSGVPLE